MNEPKPASGSFSVDPLDLLANKELDQADHERVKIIRTRAEKWIAGLTALAGLLSTVLVLKGPESVTKLATQAKVAIGLCFAVGLLALAYGTYCAYSAAFGEPFSPPEVARQPLRGLHARLLRQRIGVADIGKSRLRNAVSSTFIGIAAISIGVSIGWFAPEQKKKEEAGKHVCIYAPNDSLVAKFAGSSLTVEEVGQGSTVRPCK
jgi:hypothetical protein